MRTLTNQLRCWAARTWRNRQGQDLIEYALMTGFVAIAAMAVFPPGIVSGIHGIFRAVINALPTP